MAAATSAPVRHRTPGATSAVPLGAARLLRVELRRNAMPWILPLIAALFWFDSYRPSTGTAPLYGMRTFWNMGQGHTIVDFGPFVAGVAAWMGSRDGRRGLADLVTATARPRWTAQLATWAATAIWAVAAYLVFVGVMFAVYAHQGVGGAPPWWWVAVGATAVTAFSAAGFAVGAYWPSRFAAPAAAFGSFLALAMASQTGFSHTSGWALILPTNSNGNFQTDSGIFYPWLPDLPIARIMFLAGIAVAALGLTGLPARAGGRTLRRAAAVLTLAGVASAGTAVGLASTARLSAHGMVIPALHDAANDALITYTPACGRAAGVPVCLNPAYRRWLPDVTTALAPVLAEVAGLPGAPVRATQVAAAYSGGEGGFGQPTRLSGHPPVLRMSLGLLNLPGPCGFCDGPVATEQFTDQIRLLFAQAFTGAGNGPGSPAQQAVQAALLHGAGIPFAALPKLMAGAGNGPGPAPGPATGPVYVAAGRLATRPAAARHAWLAAHLAALQAGRLTLTDLP
jgi:ABC-type transport system involved in multi-copper enzyme maturation permease subunit